MSMPNIPNISPIINIKREDALNMLLASIALEEMGLAHIINAEGEKIQYILDPKMYKPASVAEIRDINQSVERVIRETMKLQMLLQEKLASVMDQIPRPQDPSDHPCPQPLQPKCRLDCALTGCGKGQVSNKADIFHCTVASIESSMCPLYKDCITFSLKYTLCKEKEKHVVSALLLAIPESIEVHCPNKLKLSPTPKDPNMLMMKGQGVMAIKGTARKLAQCSVEFTLTVWDLGCNSKKFQMAISSPNAEFKHDSGVVSITSGNLEIRNCDKQKTDIKFDF